MENAWNWDLSPEKRNLYIGWTLSYWCNNDCSYCFQKSHKRHQRVSRGDQIPPFRLRNPRSSLKNLMHSLTDSSSAHAFDNAKPSEWVSAFKKIGEGRKLSIGITGGEPMLDHKNMLPFLNEFLALDCIEVVRVETNGQWQREWYKELIGREKLFLNVSYHPKMIDLDKFVNNIEELLEAQFPVAMVNFVLEPSQVEHYPKIVEAMKPFGIYVDPAIYYQERSAMPTEILELVSKHLPPNDLLMKTGASTNQKLCQFPRIGAVLGPDGTFNVSCNEKSDNENILTSHRAQLDGLFTEGVHPCPHQNCFCLHMYSFLEGNQRNLKSLNPLKEFISEASNPS